MCNEWKEYLYGLQKQMAHSPIVSIINIITYLYNIITENSTHWAADKCPLPKPEVTDYGNIER